MDANNAKRGGGGGSVKSPCQTPRSTDKSNRDLRSADLNSNSFNKSEKEKGVNIQVIVRCRPFNSEETRLQTPAVLTCNDRKKEVAVAQNIAGKQIDKTFLFDKVFGPTSQQKDLYHQAVSPIVFEVLDGYNCTIFAYGQTGTGKTYTMEGGARKKNGEIPSDAGVIPRAVKQIFDILEAQSAAEYSLKVSFLELYNEELTDLLAPEETKFADDKSKKPLALMEDGKGGVFVRGLEEEIVSTADEIYKVLEKGSAKRRTAETLLNKQSSRSHSIFSVTIHIKECTPEGEEIVKSGKLNLVDLAGSENISRSGAREGRAREAGEINKSLLTLGRVINALVEHSGHIPYRESKLTRLLRDSLGGKTKTCVIATVSPSVHCLEETLSTLDYAHRAKHIKNKPEVNQKMMKSAIMKDLYGEIERLKQEVYAAREKNGIYIPKERYTQEEAEKKAMAEKIEQMEVEGEAKDKQIIELQELYNAEQLVTAGLREKLDKTEKKLRETEQALLDLEEKHRQAVATIKEKEYLISNLLKSEKTLVDRAVELQAELENAASDVSNLFAKIERKDKIEDSNRSLIQEFQSQLLTQLEVLNSSVAGSVTQQEKQLQDMEKVMASFVSAKTEATETLRGSLAQLKERYNSGIKSLDDIAGNLDKDSQTTLNDLNSEVTKHSCALEDMFKGFTSEAQSLLEGLQSSLHNQEEKLSAFTQQQRDLHSRSMESAKSVSEVMLDFFKTLDTHAAKLTKLADDAQNVNEQKLSAFTKKFEESIANEEKQMLEKVAELLASSHARKKELVQIAVQDIREGSSSQTGALQQEMSAMQESASSVKVQWNAHMVQVESHHLDNISAVEIAKEDMHKTLLKCLEDSRTGSQQWKTAQESLVDLEKKNVANTDSLIRGAIENNEKLRTQLSSAVSNTLSDADSANRDILSSIDNSLQLDKDASADINSTIAPTYGSLKELRTHHDNNVVQIKDNTGKCLGHEYKVDEATSSTPRKRQYNIPTVDSIEELKTPSFEELLKAFHDSSKSPKQMQQHSNGEAKHVSNGGRPPLTAIN
ncbi:P-loop containing nucleoside triphosphate hydrolases superfamily protein [Raphanus sativus]|uniref:Kinesin-like protein KIN-5A n=1 Tax=Raphanus sativus TaxID=3726 RepID=A0A6J0NJS8_RAPSA|nr:kinesin-like protein KIN-5A [Raphanus sativus]XP_018484806.1 kinesin-like protein KIN-5A [Raphanus sativus]KAJ4903174.1 P-loop containing nucleoside triphosphate hydrolases superfamily protein [Raphanus sativus]